MHKGKHECIQQTLVQTVKCLHSINTVTKNTGANSKICPKIVHTLHMMPQLASLYYIKSCWLLASRDFTVAILNIGDHCNNGLYSIEPRIIPLHCTCALSTTNSDNQTTDTCTCTPYRVNTGVPIDL